MEVVGDGHVGIYDGKDHDGNAYVELSPGQRFDLTKHVVVSGG